MESNTKERILEEALTLFSQNGYAGTSMSDIAGALGITKAALYKHFSAKEEMLNALLQKGEEQYQMKFGSLAHPPKIPESIEELKELSLRQITYTMHAPDVKKYRKLFTIEQFHNERIAEFATMHFLTGLESLYTMIFEKMMKKGTLKQEDPGFLSFEYLTPVTLMIQQCDRQPEWEEKAMERIRRHIDYFLETHAVKPGL